MVPPPAQLQPAGAAGPAARRSERDSVRALAVVGLASASSRSLLARTDTKFLIPRSRLPQFIERLEAHVGVLPAAGEAHAEYRTQYFDTPALDCFHDHRRGRPTRYKVRLRYYADRAVTFLEVKLRRAAGDTRKFRREVPVYGPALSGDDLAFLAPLIPARLAPLVPSIEATFSRVTLVGLRAEERVTIDVDVTFALGHETASAGECVFVEVKQPRLNRQSPTMLALRETGARPQRISKYCTGTMLLRTDVRSNRLLPSLRALRKVSHG